MYLPFMNFEKSMQQCILALAPPKTFSNLPGEHDGDEPNALILGQRFLSKYKFIAIVDRNTNTIATAIQSGDSDDLLAQFFTLAFIILGIIIILMFLLCYLVWLRSRRIMAEKWLVEHQEEIVQYAMFKKTEELTGLEVEEEDSSDEDKP